MLSKNPLALQKHLQKNMSDSSIQETSKETIDLEKIYDIGKKKRVMYKFRRAVKNMQLLERNDPEEFQRRLVDKRMDLNKNND